MFWLLKHSSVKTEKILPWNGTTLAKPPPDAIWNIYWPLVTTPFFEVELGYLLV